MKFISIESRVYKLTERQFEKIENSFDKEEPDQLDEYLAAVESLGRYVYSLDGRYNY